MYQSKKNPLSILLLALLAALMFVPIAERQTATACWNAVLTECFDRQWDTFPWQNPIGSGRQWRRNPNPPQDSWGIQEVVYSVQLSGLCGEDIQSAWMQGGAGADDPDFDPYRPNKTIYMTYGPFDLSSATDAVIQFELLCNSELFGDSIYWGIANNFNLPNATILLIDSTFSGRTVEQMGQAWAWISADLSDLHEVDGDPGSALGMPTVYAFWWWKANSNNVSTNPLHNGAFVDNVIIQWDDGFLDLDAGGVSILTEDTVVVSSEATIGDSIMARYTWSTCAGGVDLYPPVRVRVTSTNPLGVDSIVVDTLVENAPPDTIYTWYTPAWDLSILGEYIVTLSLDPENTVEESDETNNITAAPITTIPVNIIPTFEWIVPAADTVQTEDSVMLKWEVYDPDDVASFSIYIDPDHAGCFGNIVPGAAGLSENDGPDSIMWNCQALLNYQVRYPFVLLSDGQYDTCIYAPYPVQKIPPDAAQELPAGVPDEFFLTQNYPNPFNPETEIQFGLTKGGFVSLRVFDVLGRQVAELVNENMTPGTYISLFNGRDLASGVYLYTLTTPEGSLNRKMILMK